MDFELAEYTHIGQRETNQDYFCHVIHSDWGCFMVADGLGGHASGEIASQYFLEALMSQCSHFAEEINKTKEAGLKSMIKKAGELFQHRIKDEFKTLDTHTTLALAWVNKKNLITAHIGDSRVYRLNHKSILWRSPDHTDVQRLFDAGKISEEDMMDHPDQNTLIRTVNTKALPKPEIHVHPTLNEHQGLLLCTDGLWTTIDDSTKFDLLKSKNMYQTLENTIHEVIDTPECDNVTAQCVRLKN